MVLPKIIEDFHTRTVSEALLLAAPEIAAGMFAAADRESLGLLSKMSYQEIADLLNVPVLRL